MKNLQPFSKRSINSQWIQNDFPPTARIALKHLLFELVKLSYVEGWILVDKELRRIARLTPIQYDPYSVDSINSALSSSDKIINEIEWGKVFDFCERLYTYLASEVLTWDEYSEHPTLTTSKDEVKKYIANEIERIFLEEELAYSFNSGLVQRKGRKHTREQIAKAESNLGDPRLDDARRHYAKALNYFEHPQNPDYENSVKEAVCAIEAAAKKLFPDVKATTLGKLLNQITGNEIGQLPSSLANTITGLYAFRNTGVGVSHGSTGGGKVTFFIAEYALAVAASQIILLQEIANSSGKDVPF